MSIRLSNPRPSCASPRLWPRLLTRAAPALLTFHAATAHADDFGNPSGLWQRPNLFGTMDGLRTQLGQYGIRLGLSETSEVLGNVSGGVRQGADYDGLLQMGLGLDTSKWLGWQGGIFNVSALQIRGRDLSTDNLLSLQTASGIEAIPSTRLWELWFQQQLAGGTADIKIGQQSADQEFITSEGSSLFLNTAMGWPLYPSVNLYAGGPAYPLSSLGVRVRAFPTDTLTVLGGAFDDNPPGGPFFDDSQVRGAEQSGAKFNTGTGALMIAELQYALNAPPSASEAGAASPSASTPQPATPGLPGTYKVGFWYDTGTFYDQQFDTDGLPLASPASNGTSRALHGNWSVYGVADQVVWRPDPKGARALGVFLRMMGGPGDRNLVDVSVNGGVTLKSPFADRDSDTVGVGFGIAHISPGAAGYASDLRALVNPAVPSRTAETFIEITYQAQLVPWWQVQPDIQYVINPSGGTLDPLQAGRRVGNELVLGLRTVVTF